MKKKPTNRPTKLSLGKKKITPLEKKSAMIFGGSVFTTPPPNGSWLCP